MSASLHTLMYVKIKDAKWLDFLDLSHRVSYKQVSMANFDKPDRFLAVNSNVETII